VKTPSIKRWVTYLNKELIKTSNIKKQQGFHTKSIFHELDLVMKITKALNPHKNNIQIKTNKDDAKDANV
jgi:hypothetical protein